MVRTFKTRTHGTKRQVGKKFPVDTRSAMRKKKRLPKIPNPMVPKGTKNQKVKVDTYGLRIMYPHLSESDIRKLAKKEKARRERERLEEMTEHQVVVAPLTKQYPRDIYPWESECGKPFKTRKEALRHEANCPMCAKKKFSAQPNIIFTIKSVEAAKTVVEQTKELTSRARTSGEMYAITRRLRNTIKNIDSLLEKKHKYSIPTQLKLETIRKIYDDRLREIYRFTRYFKHHGY